ncbi:hypothetical protein ID866_3678 [Astraeus odoratus]|nr:hypothetical protein ID866_3678 [Astraeus odoratus]
MYVIMMYISVYPIALSVRSTNVYEEQSLGVFRDEDSDEEDDFEPTGSRIAIWGRYLTMHARRQLSFDMWWLSLALFLRDNLDNTSIQSWFNIFTIQFELVSAYGSVGLSLGADNQNYSFSGTLRPLSKLVICLVMLRGRHRGLPVAIDRAIMLPLEFNDPREQNSDPRPPADEARATRHSTSGRSRNIPRSYATMLPPSSLSRSVGRDRAHDADAAIRQTDADAALARLSAVKKGYLADPFIGHFVSRAQFQPLRPPLINIGTYVRSHSIDRLTEQWMEISKQEHKQCQIVSLGAGSDTRFWRIATGPYKDQLQLYIELDFPEVTTKKAMSIRKSRDLSAVLGPPETISVGEVLDFCEGTTASILAAQGGTALHSPKYHVLPCDLRRTPSEVLPSLLGDILSSTLPTLLLFECVLVYMSPEASSNLIQWFVDYFQHDSHVSDPRVLGALVYEMFGLQDSFGQVMMNNLRVGLFLLSAGLSDSDLRQSRNVTLPGATPYPNPVSLPRRFTRHNFTFSKALTLRDIRESYISQSELARISTLEMLDEVEELNLVLEHYAITWGVKLDGYSDSSNIPWDQWGMSRKPEPSNEYE